MKENKIRIIACIKTVLASLGNKQPNLCIFKKKIIQQGRTIESKDKRYLINKVIILLSSKNYYVCTVVVRFLVITTFYVQSEMMMMISDIDSCFVVDRS